MLIEKYDHGVPSWIDIGTTDLPGAIAFYSALFGWECNEGPPEFGGYTMALVKGEPVAGLGPQMNPEAPPAWTTYINVESADDIAAKVTEAGGAVFMGPMDVMDQGRFAVFADTTGGVFGVWQPGTNTGARLANEPGTLSWNEIISTDTAASQAFYGAVFDWGVKANESDRGPAYFEWQVDGRSVGGMLPKPPMMPAEMPTVWTVYFAVEDLDLSVARVKDLGGSVMIARQDTPAGPFAAVSDPQGAMFNLIELADRSRD